MSRRSDDTVSYTEAELEARRKRGETMSRWKQAATQAVPDGSDPDDAMEEIDWATAELPVRRPKVHASLRVDADVMEWFKGQGRGYQTKINAVLRSYFQQHGR